MTQREKMADHVDAFIQVRSRNWTVASVQTARSILDRFAAEWDRTRRSPKSITREWIEDHLAGFEVRASTLGIYEGQIRRFIAWAEMRSLVPLGTQDWDKVGGSTSRRTRDFLRLSPPQLQALYLEADNWYTRGLLSCLVFTAARGGEVRESRISDVHLDEKYINWSRPKISDYGDMMPINEQFAPELQRYLTSYGQQTMKQYGRGLQPDDYLFPRWRRRGGHRTEFVYPQERRYRLADLVRRELSRVLDVEAPPEGEAAHTVRRSMATHLYRTFRDEGWSDPMGRVQAFLGHTERKTTERYIGHSVLRDARDEAVLAAPFFAVKEATVVDIADLRGRQAAGDGN